MLHLFVDADACPVKQEVYRVAKRYDLDVTLVAGSWMRVPEEDNLSLRVVGEGMDAADDGIVEHLEIDDIVITADIPLAARCLQKAAYAWVLRVGHLPERTLARSWQLAICSLRCATSVRAWEALRRFTKRTVPAFSIDSTKR